MPFSPCLLLSILWNCHCHLLMFVEHTCSALDGMNWDSCLGEQHSCAEFSALSLTLSGPSSLPKARPPCADGPCEDLHRGWGFQRSCLRTELCHSAGGSSWWVQEC